MTDWYEQLTPRQLSLLEHLYKDTAAIKHNRFDTRQYQEIRDAAEELQDLVDSLSDDYDTWPALVQDNYMALWKAVPELNNPAEVEPSHLLNHTVMGFAMDTPEFAQLRTWTELDDWAAAMGAVEFAPKVAAYLQEQKELSDSQQQLEADKKTVDEALQDLEDAVEAERNYEKQLQDLQDALDQYGDSADQSGAAIQKHQGGLRRAAEEAIDHAYHKTDEAAATVAGFGTDPGLLQRLPAKDRMQLASRIRRSSKLQRLAELVGRFKRFAMGEQANKITHGMDEMYSVTVGGDPNRLLPSEFAYLAVPELEPIFYRKFIEKELLEYEMRGVEKVARGALIVMIDNSGSMNGTREMWAKAIGLALLDVAHKQGRDFYGIHFSSSRDSLQEFFFPKGKTDDMNKVLDFAEYFYGGGTDFELPLTRGLEVLEQQFSDEQSQKGDLVLITDDECWVSEEFSRRFAEKKQELACRLYGLAIGGYGEDGTLGSLSDSYMSITDLVDPGDAREVFAYI